MKKVLVTGSNGQLAKSIHKISTMYATIIFVYTDIEELDITNQSELNNFFTDQKFDYCINCAAYTDVDKAETDIETAHKINVIGAQNLARVCSEFGVVLIHISTDFVFDGESDQLYKEEDHPLPLSTYGQTKLDGEKAIKSVFENYFIIRTSWLYSEFGNNFMKTMLRLGNDRKELSVVNDQIGTPTYAEDLANVILNIIDSQNQNFGLFHFSNKGFVSWYDFAKEIFLQEGIPVEFTPIPTSKYPTPARRPKYSVLDKTRIKKVLNVEIFDWKDSLKRALRAYRNL
jgi:dTDP-4-dehydrorhamnose reductase